MPHYPDQRCTELNEQLRCLNHRPLRVTFLPSDESAEWQYLPDDLAADCAAVSNDHLHLSYGGSLDQADLIICTAHGRNNSERLLQLRAAHPQALLAVWLWDNHLAFNRNLATVSAADLYFPSHFYCASQIPCALAAMGGHVPSCCAQWPAGLLRTALAQAGSPRSNKVYAGYVDYPVCSRRPLLHAMRDHAPEIDTILMPPGDRSRYFGQSPADRLAEWLRYPASVVLPIDRDLSTRFFDSLAAGQIPIVADSIADLDTVVPPSIQARLPVLKFRTNDIDDLRRVAQDALRLFAAGGAEAVRQRQQYVGANHLLVHRLLRMSRVATLASEGKLQARAIHDLDEGVCIVLNLPIKLE